MSRTKKIIGIFAISVLIILELLCFVSCTKETYGEFYTLEEAYDQGLISRDDLQNIFYYYRAFDKDHKLLQPQELNNDVLEKIQKDAKVTIKDYRKYYKNSDFQIECYGIYNGAVVIKFCGGDFPYWEPLTIDGVWFDYWSVEKSIKIWIEKVGSQM